MYSRQDILFSRARQILNQRYTNKRPWFDTDQCLEQTDEIGYPSASLHEDNLNMRPIKSLVICENYFSTKPVDIKELSIDQFWDYLYSGEWAGANSIRVLRGELLSLLMHCIVCLQRQGKIVAHTTFAYAKNIRPRTGCCYREKDREPLDFVQETLLIELTNFGRLIKPSPNRPMDDSIPVMRLQSHHVLRRRKKIKNKHETKVSSRTLSNNTNTVSDVLTPTGQDLLVSAASKDPELLSPDNSKSSAKRTHMKITLDYERRYTSEAAIYIEMTPKIKEEAAVKLNQQLSTDHLGKALYLEDQMGPSAIHMAETTAMKLQRRKKELQKEREQRKPLTTEHELGRKPLFPKFEPPDPVSNNRKGYYNPITSFDTVPTLEQMIQFMKDEEYYDPRFKIDKPTFKKRKVINKYNLAPGAIKYKLKNVLRRHAICPLHYNYSWGKYLKKRYASSLEHDEGDEWIDDMTEGIETSPEISFNKYPKRCLMLRKEDVDAEKSPKSKRAPMVGGITDCSARVKHVGLNALTEQIEYFQDESSKALVTPVDIDDPVVHVAREESISPAEQDSIQEILFINTSENVEYLLQNTLSSTSSIESKYDSQLTEITDSQNTPHTTPLDKKTETGTVVCAAHFPKINLIKGELEESPIFESSEESGVDPEQEEPSNNKFDTTKLNLRYSAEKLRQKRRLQTRNTAISEILGKSYGIQGVQRESHISKPDDEERLAKVGSKNLWIVPRSRQYKESGSEMPVMIGKLCTFNFLSKFSTSKKISMSTPIPFHFTGSSTDKYLLRFHQALDDFVVRRESVMSNKKGRCCATVTFTRKSVFALHRN